MAKRKDKQAERVRQVFNRSNQSNRIQWEYINQKSFDFANDNQLTAKERQDLEDQGMPTFTINRIAPVVEMLNFYATANDPRWQAVAVDGSDSKVAAVFSDMADYIWNLSKGGTLYANAVNDAITKSIGWLHVVVDPDADRGMGEVKVEQPEPFDIYVDPKSRDLLFRDAGYIMVRKILPKAQLLRLFPDKKAKINKASSSENNDYSYTEKSFNTYQKDFGYKDVVEADSVDPETGDTDTLLEYFEIYEKVKIAYMNVFYRIPPTEEQIKEIQGVVQQEIEKITQESEVQLLEQQQQLEQAVQAGEMLPERMQLEMQKFVTRMKEDIDLQRTQMMNDLVQKATRVDNKVVTEKEYNILQKDTSFNNILQEAIRFHGDRIRKICVAGDVTLYDIFLPDNITEYPLVPFHYKWTGTPYPISAVSPLVGKQREINKSHQLMVHNASLGSSLRWLHEEGAIDTDYWEKYSSAPGALLPVRPGSTPPTPVQPAPLSNAFFQIVQEGKGDMEYLAGIYSSMQGDTGSQHETYRGMLAQDEYGTRRVKQWMKNSIEPGLKQLGEVIKQFSQSVYTAHKVFRIVQPSALQEDREVQINVPMYNDFGDVIERHMDYETARFDVRVITGSTLPLNRWAYLAELKDMMQLGIIDDMAVLAETDIKDKQAIAERKSQLSQLQGQVSGLEESLKDKEGTIETLERQLVQAGIKGKVMQAEMEIDKQKNQVKNKTEKEYLETQAKQKLLRNRMSDDASSMKKQGQADMKNKSKEMDLQIKSVINSLQGNKEQS
jgi:hypothetical protein